MVTLSCMVAPMAVALVAIWTHIGVSASPPGPVIKCTSGNSNCTVTNGYGSFPDWTTCQVASVAYPTNESELLVVVSNASMNKQKMKAVSVYSHSIPKLSCPGGPSGAGLAISTMRLNHVVSVDSTLMRMTVESGITMRALIDAAAKIGLAVPPSPYWLGVTLGGLLSTGSHGSSLFGKGSAVHEYVVGMRLVVPSNESISGSYARIVDLGEDDPDLLAAKVSLGVLGVISQVTLQLQPMFKRSITNRVLADTAFESTITTFGATTEFGDLTWYPSQARVVYRDDVRVPISTVGNGENDFTGFRSQLSLLIVATRGIEVVFEATENSYGKCMQSRVQVTTLLETGMGLRNNPKSILEFTGYPVIGNHSKMQAAGSCLNGSDDGLFTACGWDPRIQGVFFYQMTFSISLTNVTNFFTDVKKLRDMYPTALCGTELYGGILMKFIRNSTAYLGQVDDSLDIDITYYRSRTPATPRLNEDVLEEIEQMALFKYNGLPHWGKNRNIGFLGARAKYGPKGDMFVAAMAKYDPDGWFSSEWTDGILGLRGATVVIERKGCALDGLCVCSLDEHCAPDEGYYCRPGVVYTEARVCRRTNVS
ncbi:L-gulonolactone oxidase 2-like [Magnolia sinica]|uniref:L-gulonolactone oxidase 2-like n=1 Tax=Magnolia sinica TaxID=86752 RepID=UPI0026586655|nr:L-gulonolactone oxidase 2-like [Magnolia sinica]